jgi:hypothetical protein
MSAVTAVAPLPTAQRVERMLGREPRGSERWARWSIGLWFGVGAAWIIMGITQVVTGQSTETEFEWISFAVGALYLLTAGTQYFTYRHMRRAGSAEAQVEGRAEPGRPGAGG